MLQSCTINTETTFHKDANTSVITVMDLSEVLHMLPKENLAEYDKIPKDWTNLYEIQKSEEKTATNPDTIKLMKKMYAKSNYKNDNFTGLSFKFDRFSKADYEALNSQPHLTKIIPNNNQAYNDWDGKKLTINTEKLNVDGYEDSANDKNKDKNLTPEEKKEAEEIDKYVNDLMSYKISNTLKFEGKIKSIRGKHNWVKQLNDNTIQINYESDMVLEGNKNLKDKDKKK